MKSWSRERGERTAIPNGWASASIEDIFAPLEDGRTLHQGWSPQCEKVPRTNDDWGVLKTTAIQAGAFSPAHNKRLPDGLKPRPQIEVKQGDILITCAGPRSRCGVAALVRSTPPKLMMSGKMYRLRVPEEFFDARFLEAFLQTSAAYDSIDRMKTGGSDSGLNLTHDRFRQLKVPVAPLNEQRRIVETYEELTSDLDAGVAALGRVREKLKLYRASVLKAAVGGALTAEWRNWHPQVEHASEPLKRILAERRRRWEEDQLAQFKAKNLEPPKNWKAKYREPSAADTGNLSSLPDGWSWATVEQVASARARSIQSGPFGSQLLHSEFSHGGYLAIGIDNVLDGKFSLGSEHRITQETFDRLRKFEARPRDVVVTVMATVGRVCVLPPDLQSSIITKHCYRITADDRIADPEFLAIALRAESPTRLYIYGNIRGQTRPGINGPTLKLAPVALPPRTEQEAIVEAVEDQLSIVDHLEADIDKKLKTAQPLRQAILRHAFTGQLVPQDPSDEPASELLKRIATEREARTREAAAAKRAAKKTNGASRRRPVKQKQKEQVD